MNKKYENYYVCSDDAETLVHENYRYAVKSYGRASSPKTLYGVDLFGNQSVIFSHK